MNAEDQVTRRDLIKAYAMLALSWFVNLCVMAFCLWWTVASSRRLERSVLDIVRAPIRPPTRAPGLISRVACAQVLIEWMLSIAFSWLAAEPFIIILMALTPIVAGDAMTRLKAMACCMFCYETIGIDVTFWASLFL